jgi:hypothetical protein
MFRSGTSLSTRLVQQWGAYAGLEQELFGDRYGYLEHLGLQRLNDELMEGNDRVPPAPEALAGRAQDAQLRERALQLLDAMDNETEGQPAAAWVWKDPRLPMVLPFWEKIWGDVIYVIPIRNPVETILSGASMEGVPADALPLSAGFAYWQFNMLNILSFTQRSRRKVFMAFDQLTRNPWAECARLCRFLDEQTGGQSASPAEKIEALAARVQSSEHHFHEARSLAEIAQTTREQRALYNFLRAKVLYPDEAFNQDDFALYPGWREYLQAVDTLLGTEGSQDA